MRTRSQIVVMNSVICFSVECMQLLTARNMFNVQVQSIKAFVDNPIHIIRLKRCKQLILTIYALQ